MVDAKYSNSQAQSLVNECAGSAPICVNQGPETQSDGTASAPIVSLPSREGAQGPPGRA